MRTSIGEIAVSNSVLTKIAVHTAEAIPGVYKISGNISEKLSVLIHRKTTPASGARVNQSEDNVVVDLVMVATYGTNIQNTARQVQKQVTQILESLTGLSVERVNIRVDGIKVAENPARKEVRTEGSRVK